ncbi:MAG: PqqD family peptide modification chaperone [Acidobacteriota bacterium]
MLDTEPSHGSIVSLVDGLTLVKFYRASPATRDVPLIVLSTKTVAIHPTVPSGADWLDIGEAPVYVTSSPCCEISCNSRSRWMMRVSIPDQILMQELEDEVVLLDLESGRYFGLAAVGARAWQLLSETGDTEETFAKLAGEYAVDEATLRRDLDEFWQQLLDARLLTAAPKT